MTTSAETMDLCFDLREARRLRMRRFMRVAVPIVTLVILLASIAGIGAYLYRANRADARVLTDDLLRELERRIVAEVIAFLEPASNMVRLVEQALANERLFDQYERLAEPLSAHILESNPQLASLYFADPRGNFLMVRRSPDGSVDTKIIDRRGDGVETTLVRRDPNGRIVSMEKDPSDTFDPRTRPWYQGATDSGELFWSDVYLFFSNQHPGITASLPITDADGTLTAVYAVDIALEDLSTFLGSLEIGIHGRALIFDSRGVLVAFPELERMLKTTDTGVVRARLEELDDPVLNRAYDYFRVDGPGSREFRVGTERYISTATSLAPTLGRDWTLMVVAPENDFVGFVADNNRRGLYMSVIVLCVASLLAGLLVVQGLRADRNAQLVLERSEQLESQSRVFSTLAAQAALFDVDDQAGVSALTERVAGVVGARRVSVWQLSDDARQLVCDDVFDRESVGHTGGMTFSTDQLPQFFESVTAGREIVISNAANDPRTAELHRIYLHPLGCRAISAIPIGKSDRPLGVLSFEYDVSDPEQQTEDVEFGRAVANLLALRMRRRSEHRDSNAGARMRVQSFSQARGIAEPMRETELVSGPRAQALRERIARLHGENASVKPQISDNVTVAAIRFTDPLSLISSVGEESRNALDELVSKFETIAIEQDVEYLKMLGNQIVCAAGIDCGAEEGAHAVAAFAVYASECCARLFTDLQRPMEFRIGIDSGPVIGSVVGRERTVFNLWGETVITAVRMADTGLHGQIQVTESTYLLLREDYLFRVRGSFYLDGIGELTTYFLTGRMT